jgi:uncharacterized protein (TIGR00661 family)
MKIFYAIQATGNGHLSRATQLYPYLSKIGEVDFFVSGNNSSIYTPFPVKYKRKGLSLHYSKCGGLNYLDIVKNTKPLKIMKEAYDLPLKNYDIIINDFECITSLACKFQKRNSVQFGHQASFKSDKSPRPLKKNNMGELVLKHYSSSSNYMGLHFQSYDDFIFPPVIKQELMNKKVTDHKHITVYLPAFQQDCLQAAFEKLPHIEFHWYLSSVKNSYKEKNITYFPIFQKLFNESLLSCHGLITGGGFETPSEALFLGKKLMSIPIQDHYEQQCNAAALSKMGVCVLDAIDENFSNQIAQWYDNPNQDINIKANNIQETLQYLVDTYPYKKDSFLEEQLMFI